MSMPSSTGFRLGARDVDPLELEVAAAPAGLAHVERDDARHVGMRDEQRQQSLTDETGRAGDGDRRHVHTLTAWPTILNPRTPE